MALAERVAQAAGAAGAAGKAIRLRAVWAPRTMDGAMRAKASPDGPPNLAASAVEVDEEEEQQQKQEHDEAAEGGGWPSWWGGRDVDPDDEWAQ